MPRIVLANLRRRPGRALALLLGVLVATTGFTVLTGATETARLQVTGTVEEHFRGAYDILVRPAGSRTAREAQAGEVRPNFLSGQYGGITHAQRQQIAALPGVQLAAPIGMVGYVELFGAVTFDVADLVDRSADQQLLRIRRSWSTDRGLSTIEDPGLIYLYVTSNQVLFPDGGVYLDQAGEQVQVDTSVCEGDPYIPPPAELLPDGRAVPICEVQDFAREVGVAGGTGLTAGQRSDMQVAQLLPDGTFRRARTQERTLPVGFLWPMSLLLAAIDPEAEAALVGTDRAVVSGSYLRPGGEPIELEGTDNVRVPMLATDSPRLDEHVTARVERLTDPPPTLAAPKDELRQRLAAAPGAQLAAVQFDAGDGYQGILDRLEEQPDPGGAQVIVDRILQSGAPRYSAGEDPVLRPQQVDIDREELWRRERIGSSQDASLFVQDTGFRPLRRLTGYRGLGAVTGVYDPSLLTEFSPLSRVPLETYRPAQAAGADDRSRQLLGDRPLAPNSNPAGYLATPPQLLTTFATLDALLPDSAAFLDAPISAVRVRVAGVTGLDEISRERVRVAAEQIATDTGLDVDIMLGSSPIPREVALPAGEFGRPLLHLTESWSAKNVATRIIDAVDRKSLVLFGLILLVCVLFVANATAAAVRDRRRELAVLACLGWPRWRLASTVAGEVALLGLLAGILAALAAPLFGELAGVAVPATRAWLAVPVALGLAVLASLVPAVGAAARAHPGGAVQPAVLPPRTSRRRSRRSSSRRHRTIAGIAAGNLARMPGRTALGVLALAVGVGGLTLVAAITWVFHGTITGSLLGDAVSVQVRGVDLVAVAATILLGLVAVADVLYINVRERAPELATLRATGWTAAAVGRLVTLEGLGIGALGAAAGGAAGLAGAAWFAGTLPASLVWVAAGVAAGGFLLGGLAALIPAAVRARTPMSTQLAEE